MTSSLLAAVRSAALAFDDDTMPAALLEMLAQRRLALLGEATHGTHEFYALRAAITRALVEQHGCKAVVIEGDWPDAWRINRWVRGEDAGTAAQALAGFERFPTWMWRNTVMRDFIAWLRRWNAARPPGERTGVYGMDLYSLHTSMRAVLGYLEQTDPAAAQRARERYACFDHFADPQSYGWAASAGASESCEDAVVAQLTELLRQRAGQLPHDDPDALFHAQQNARLVLDAEHYYRSMFRGRVSSWNLRDQHMVETLQALDAYLHERTGAPPRMAVWAHNSHLGDASTTGMGARGEWNVGELARKRWPGATCLVGFTTHDGTVRAASDWDGPGEVKQVRPGLPGSWEALFHEAGLPRFLLRPGADPALRRALEQPLLERAIGVLYLPASERQSHYFTARIGRQFDAVLHLDTTRALEALPGHPHPDAAPEVPDTYPAGL